MNGRCLKKVSEFMDTVLITGTTSGIGEAFAKKFVLEGYNVILVARNQEKLRLQTEELGTNKNIKYITCDLNNENAVNIIEQSLKDWNVTVDILMNNAGFNECGLFHETSINRELEMIQVHVSSLIKLTKVLLKEMLKNNYGHIVNIGSTGSFIASPSDAVYSATKSFILSFTNALAGELRGTGVKATTICPGATNTEFAIKAGIEKTKLFGVAVMKPNEVVDSVYDKLLRGKRVIIPGWYNKIMVAYAKVLPVSVLNRMTLWMMR
jgi:Short-chain dehydrogenases of various substrate specificities